MDSAYTLARPALIQAWPRLRQWVADNREGLPVHRRLTEAARFWDGHGRKPGDLLHGSNLDRTLRWAATERRDITLLELEREFLDAAAGQSRRRGLLAATLAVCWWPRSAGARSPRMSPVTGSGCGTCRAGNSSASCSTAWQSPASQGAPRWRSARTAGRCTA
ncbi:hypothetical protein [Streptosporangium roseum]|uniref:nSTAND1 domain-containing NTPase n=1 Tax=Streptosporangium roseum TaxID=2001 RepID=UPI0012DF280A|nr:hypothetical protein [Streptosporangium roseum]